MFNINRIFQYIFVAMSFLYFFTAPFVVLKAFGVAVGMLIMSFLALIMSYRLKQEADNEDKEEKNKQPQYYSYSSYKEYLKNEVNK